MSDCYRCHRKEYQDRAGYGFLVNECRKCERPLCECCAEVDYDYRGEEDGYVCTQWQCSGQCEENENVVS